MQNSRAQWPVPEWLHLLHDYDENARRKSHGFQILVTERTITRRDQISIPPNSEVSFPVYTLTLFPLWTHSSVKREVWRQGIAPYDTALRNVIWEPRKKCCSIVDFEHYNPAQDPINMHENEEMQRWGLVQRPPPSHWAIEWGLIKEYNKRPQS